MTIENLHKIFSKNPKVSTDSRKIEPGSIFFALKGDNFDGNQYAIESISKGAVAAVVDDPSIAGQKDLYLVEDVLRTLQDLACYHRRQFLIPVIGLTGSNGKTTTKELVHAVLSTKYNCLATVGNLNNHIGVPLTLLNLTKDHEIAIIEMGANHVGEIESLCRIAMPNYGLITNIGRAHIGEFGGYQNIIKAKTELYKTMVYSDSSEIENSKVAISDGCIFVNGDDELLMEKSSSRVRHTYGSIPSNDTIGSYYTLDPLLNIKWGTKGTLIQTQLAGKYNTDNVMAAIAIGEYFKVPDEDIKNALENYCPSNNRSQIQKTGKNTLIMDAYNANPSSVEVAIENLLSMESDNRFFILGDMLELGEESEKEHQGIYNLITDTKLNGIFVGPEYQKIFKERKGLSCFNSTKDVLNEIGEMQLRDQLILVKGSRGMKLETLYPKL